MSSERSSASEEIKNMILVSCFIGRINNIPIPNAFLEYLSRHSKDTYYKVKNRLLEEDLIAVIGDKNEYIELRERGVRALSRILIGEETNNLEWKNVYEVLRREICIFGESRIRTRKSEKEKKEENLSQALLLLYSESSGDNPDDYYKNLLRNLVREYRRFDSDGLKKVLLRRLNRFYDTSSAVSRSKGRTDWENNVTNVILEFMIALVERMDEVCRKAEIALELWQHKKIARFLGSIIISYNTLVKTRLIPAYLALISVAILTIIASVRPVIGWLLGNLIANIGIWLGVAAIVIFLLGVIASIILIYRSSKRESRA